MLSAMKVSSELLLIPIGGHHYLKLRVHGGVLPHMQGAKEGGKAGRSIVYIFNIQSQMWCWKDTEQFQEKVDLF